MHIDLGTLVVIVALAAASPLIVDAVPRIVLRALAARDRVALGLYASTALRLVVAVTSLGVKDGEMRPARRPAWSAPRWCR